MENTDGKSAAAPFYPGIEVLRILGAMAVVWAHYGKFRMPVVKFAVPCFVAISFFLGWKMIESKSPERLLRSLSRLAIPFFTWGVVSYLVALALGIKSGIAPLLWQLTLGHSTCMPLYYLLDMALMMAALFAARRFLPARAFWTVVGVLVPACLFFQYSGLNYTAFGGLPFEASFPLGRLAELFPAAVAGCAIAASVPRGRGTFAAGAAISAAAVATLLCGFLAVGKEFGYAGIALFAGTVGFLAMGAAFTSENPMLNRIRIVSAATAGVYFIHTIVGDVFCHFGTRKYWPILAVSFAIAMVGLRIPFVRRAFNGRADKRKA